MFTLHLQTDYGYKFAFHFAPLPLRLPARPALYAFWRVNGGVKMYRRGGAKVSHGLGGSLSR